MYLLHRKPRQSYARNDPSKGAEPCGDRITSLHFPEGLQGRYEEGSQFNPSSLIHVVTSRVFSTWWYMTGDKQGFFWLMRCFRQFLMDQILQNYFPLRYRLDKTWRLEFLIARCLLTVSSVIKLALQKCCRSQWRTSITPATTHKLKWFWYICRQVLALVILHCNSWKLCKI